ncbi:MAG TPA: cystathionine beta-lyase [bacterium]|nr:cystathionine beta-lyase [bacterium]
MTESSHPPDTLAGLSDDTLLAHAGREPMRHHGIVNPPVYHASTILFPSLAAFKARQGQRYDGVTYGLHGTPTQFALGQAVAALEGGHKALITSSGQSAISVALSTFVAAGDHILVSDNAYGPTRNFCQKVLGRLGVETTFFDPLVGEGIAALMRPTTRLVFLESPGSLTFELQDVPGIAREVRKRGVISILDNTWGTPLFFKPLARGVDVSVHAGTKYIAGHSDVMLGVISVGTEALYRRLKDTQGLFGDCPGPDDCYMALRGLRTLAVRLRQHQQSALRVARWLQERPEVQRVLYPALPDDPGHALWKRDYTGACGLFGVLLRTSDEAAVARMLDGLRLFKIGASWGGYESLIIPAYPAEFRTARPWREPGFLLRLHVGLEAVEDLIDDLALGLARLNGAAAK